MSPEIHTAVMHNMHLHDSSWKKTQLTKGHIGTSGLGSSENVS